MASCENCLGSGRVWSRITEGYEPCPDCFGRPKKTAKEFASSLVANAAAFGLKAIDWSTFDARQKAEWRAVEAAGSKTKNEVLRLLRELDPRSADYAGGAA